MLFICIINVLGRCRFSDSYFLEFNFRFSGKSHFIGNTDVDMLLLCTAENCLPELRLGFVGKLEYCIVIQMLAVASIIFARIHPASISNLSNSLGYVCWTSFLVSCFCFSSVSAKLDILWLLAECFSFSAVSVQHVNWISFFNSNYAMEYLIVRDWRKPISGVMKARKLTRTSWKVPRSP